MTHGHARTLWRRVRALGWALPLWLAAAAAPAAERVLLGAPGTAVLAARTDGATVQRLNQLRVQAVARGTVRVLVGLRVPFAPQGALAAGEAANQRNEIAIARSAVVARLAQANIRARAMRSFDTVPFVGLTLTAGELDQVTRMAEVSSVNEDQAHPPTLAYSVPHIGGTTAWASGYAGAGQVVAVLDSGVDKTHPLLAGKVVAEGCYSSNYSDQGLEVESLCPAGVTETTAPDSGLNCTGASGCEHGTHVAGIVAGANGQPELAPGGVARDAGIIAMQVFSRFTVSGSCASPPCISSYQSDQIKALERVMALSGSYNIAAVNMSLGGGKYTSQALCNSDHAAGKAAIDNLRSLGIATVVSSGNNGYTDGLSAPACISSAISVGATHVRVGSNNNCPNGGAQLGTSTTDAVACFSNSAPFLSLLAPGALVVSSVPTAAYAYMSGTSMAAPHVAGAWAVMKQRHPTASVDAILGALVATATGVTDPRNSISKPRVNVAQALGANTLPAPASWALGVALAGTGAGSVTSSPAGISCGGTCSASYAHGTSVVLTATPAGGASFTGWSGACTGAGSCTVSMTAARNVTASFSAAPHVRVLVGKAGSGTGTVTGADSIQCGSVCSEAVATGSVVSLSAIPASGSVFTGWSGGCSGNGGCIFSAAQDTSVTATFGLQPVATTTALSEGGLAAATGTTSRYSVTTPAGATNLVIRTSGGTGDADLYVRTSQLPTLTTFDCAPLQPTNNESCTLATPGAGTTYHIMLHAYAAYSGVQLSVTYQMPEAPPDLMNVINLLLLSQ